MFEENEKRAKPLYHSIQHLKQPSTSTHTTIRSCRLKVIATQRSSVGRVRSSHQNFRLIKSLKFLKIFTFKPKVKTVTKKLSFVLCIWAENLLMNILRDSQLVIFPHSTTFITFSYKSLAGYPFKFLQSWRGRKPEVALDFCVWPLCG